MKENADTAAAGGRRHLTPALVLTAATEREGGGVRPGSPTPPAGGRIQRGAARITGSPLFWIGLLFFTFVLPLGLSMLRTPPEPPAVYGRVPPFRLIDQWSHPFGLEDLEGRVWVANFIFTRCGTVCPRLTEVMVEVQHRVRNLNDAVHLVSFTVDPENDSPEVLLEYARSHAFNPLRWSFLTGPGDAVDAIVVGAFESAVIRPDPHEPDSAAIVHGQSMVLIDQEGWIRGFYLPEEEGVERLLADINYVVNAPPRTAAPLPAVIRTAPLPPEPRRSLDFERAAR